MSDAVQFHTPEPVDTKPEQPAKPKTTAKPKPSKWQPFTLADAAQHRTP